MKVLLKATYKNPTDKDGWYSVRIPGTLERKGKGFWGIKGDIKDKNFVWSANDEDFNRPAFMAFLRGDSKVFSQTDDKFFWELERVGA